MGTGKKRGRQSYEGPLLDINEVAVPEVLTFKRPRKEERSTRGGRKWYWKHLKQMLQMEESLCDPDKPNVTYAQLEAPPSIYPPVKYCDLTGLEAPYTDPKTKLRYASADMFPLVRALPEETAQALLRIRQAHTVLR